MKRLRRLLNSFTRRGPILVDQAVSGAGNALPLILASARLETDALASLSLALLLGTTAIGLQRSLLLEPTLSIIGGAQKRWHGPLIGLGLSAGLAAVMAAFAALAGLALDPLSFGSVFLAVLAVCFQDFLRYRALHAARVYRAIGSDSTWLVVSSVAVLSLPATWQLLLLGWGAGALVGVAWLAFRLAHPKHDQLLREAWRRGKFQITEMGVSTLLTVVPFFIAAALGFDARVAALRLVQSALGPLNTIHSAVSLSMLIESDRLASQDRVATIAMRNRIRNVIVVTSVVYVACVAVFFWLFPVASGGVSANLPISILLLGVAVVLTSAASPTIVLLRTFGRQDLVLWGRVVIVVIAAVVTAIAVALAWPYLDPASTIILAAAIIGLPVWHVLFARQTRNLQ